MERINGTVIVSNSNKGLLTDKVAKTVYEDGTVVLVNYGRQSYTVDGVEVGAMDYLARKGAE